MMTHDELTIYWNAFWGGVRDGVRSSAIWIFSIVAGTACALAEPYIGQGAALLCGVIFGGVMGYVIARRTASKRVETAWIEWRKCLGRASTLRDRKGEAR